MVFTENQEKPPSRFFQETRLFTVHAASARGAPPPRRRRRRGRGGGPRSGSSSELMPRSADPLPPPKSTHYAQVRRAGEREARGPRPRSVRAGKSGPVAFEAPNDCGLEEVPSRAQPARAPTATAGRSPSARRAPAGTSAGPRAPLPRAPLPSFSIRVGLIPSTAALPARGPSDEPRPASRPRWLGIQEGTAAEPEAARPEARQFRGSPRHLGVPAALPRPQLCTLLPRGPSSPDSS